MEDELRQTGIEIIGKVPWGTHFCQFYRTKEDLLDTLVPYFKAGLDSNEFCMWVTSEPLGVEEAIEAMRGAVPGFDSHLKKGQIEILPHDEWYLDGGVFEQDRVLRGWVEKLNQAISRGFTGLRLTGNTFWLEKKDWNSFAQYEAAVQSVIGGYRMLALCTYSLDRCATSDILDVMRTHQFALIRKEGKMELVENAAYRQAEKELRTARRFLEIANRHSELMPLLKELVEEMKVLTKCEAVGIRLMDEAGNIPYAAYDGFSLEFYESESPLSVNRDRCLCVNVLRGEADSRKLFYTSHGSFYTNDLGRFVATVSEEEKGETRNVCSAAGYESLALVPICSATAIVGLIHLADHERNKVPRELVGQVEQISAMLGVGIQRARAEEAAKERERFLKVVVETIPSGLVVFSDTHGKIALINGRALELWGADRSGMNLQAYLRSLRFTTLDGRTCLTSELPGSRALRAGEVVLNNEFIVRRPDGTHVTVSGSAAPVMDESGRAVAAVTVFHDISERKRTEQRLAYLASYPELNPMFVMEMDLTGKMVYVNPATRKFFPEMEELGGNHPFLAGLVEEFGSARSPENDRINREVKVGQKYYQQFAVKREETGSLRIYGFDMTERKQAEDERKRSEEDLKIKTEELARSNAELEQFAYIASHDLQEPLRMVSSYVQLLSDRYKGKLDQEADDFIHYAHDGAARMQMLINDLLAYSRVNTRGKPFREVSLEEALLRAVGNLKLAIKDQAAEVTNEALPVIYGDGGQLAQVFQNLIDNAIKFRRGGPPSVHISAEIKGNQCVVSVRDNGIGIASEYFDKVFLIFQRLHTRKEYPGTGIGLAVCKRIVERHGGRIWVESRLGEGSTFYFTVPATKPAEAPGQGLT